jgi:hypothetical protein
MVTIPDKRPEIIKRMIILIIILVVLGAIVFGVWFFYKNKATSPKGDLSSIKVSTVPPATEVAKKETEARMAVVNVENDFISGLGECLNRFKNLEFMRTNEVAKLNEEMINADLMGTQDYHVCLAVKNNDVKNCDALKSNAKSYSFCQNEYDQTINMKFPALKSNSCDQQIIDACARSGGGDRSQCEIVCQGLYLGNIDECNKIEDGSPLKSACLSIIKKDVGICSDPKNANDKDGICEEEYYFVTAVKENKPSLLDNIKELNRRDLYELYFDNNYRCEKMLSVFGENACNTKYNADSLKKAQDAASNSQENNVQK